MPVLQKVAKLKAQLQLDVKEKVQRKAGWTDAEKAKMRAAGAWTRVAPLDVTIEEDSVETLLEARTEAKKEKNYAVADEHAAKLQQMGVCYGKHPKFVVRLQLCSPDSRFDPCHLHLIPPQNPCDVNRLHIAACRV